MHATAAVMGEIGLPAPAKELAARHWDAIVVGVGHNGLTCAAYLARAGEQVLVLGARTRVGGACALEETWPGFRASRLSGGHIFQGECLPEYMWDRHLGYATPMTGV